MTLGNAWAFPAADQDAGLGAMRALADELRALTAACDERGHPIDLFRVLEPACLRAAEDVTRTRSLNVPIPKLCTLVVASPFDAALHDAYGKAFGLSSYETYGSRFMNNDLSQDLGPSFKGEYLDRYVPSKPRASTFVFHSVGASDPLEASDVRTRIDDGLPNTLEEWIPHDGLLRFKIKLNGGDLAADFERVVRIDRVVTRIQNARAVADWKYSLDFNEGCPNVGYLLEFLHRVREATPSGFERILYIEQPTARDLKKDRANVMHEAARLRPVVIDESLTDLETLLLAREMGYTGVALKACKGQSQAMLMAAAAQKFGMFLCVQDLTCPGASLIHSAGIAARVPGNAGIEANARQFVPIANQPWERRFPGLFSIRDGAMNTGQLTGQGLGAAPPRAGTTASQRSKRHV
jgi:L-alanine-DL-glutamate epimerase-like enolase superfamily enzyme